MGETRVDLLHLLEDLRDAYPGALEETILVEIVANALDSGARRIAIDTDPVGATLSAVDDGSGMRRGELARYHDVAASTKTRGQGIGFAGVGIKLGLLVSEEVVTESRRGKTHVATRWHLASRHKAPWKWIPPPGRVQERGIAIQLRLRNALSPLLDAGFVEAVLRRNYRALLEPMFARLLAAHYPEAIRFEIHGRTLPPEPPPGPEFAALEIRLARKRKPSALGYLVRATAALPEERRGLAISTFGKVIKSGWDWLGITPSAPELVSGLIEAPALSECLTLNKSDFIRSGPRGATYLAYRKAIQEAVSRQLAAWGDTRDQAREPRAARPIERDLERVLVDLADDFPLLASLVERKAGGQRRLPIGIRSRDDARELVAASAGLAAEEVDVRASSSIAQAPLPDARLPPPTAQPLPTTTAPPAAGGPRRPTRYGLSIQLRDEVGDPELARLIESTVWINTAHPAYRRADASRSIGYHIALSVAMAIAPLAVEPAEERAFLRAFLQCWGTAVQPPRKRRRA